MTKTEYDTLNEILGEAQEVRSGLRAILNLQKTDDYEGDDIFTLIEWASEKLKHVNSDLDDMLTKADLNQDNHDGESE